MNSVSVFGCALLSILGYIQGLHTSKVLENTPWDSGKLVEYFGEFNGKSFYGGLEKATQGEAIKFCKDFGMQLVAFSSYDELNFVANVVDDFFWTSGEKNGIWKTNGNLIGLPVSGLPVAMGVRFGPTGPQLLDINYPSTDFRPLCEI